MRETGDRGVLFFLFFKFKKIVQVDNKPNKLLINNFKLLSSSISEHEIKKEIFLLLKKIRLNQLNRMVTAKLSCLAICILLLASGMSCDSSADLVNTKVDRAIDLTAHLVYITNTITVENTATSGAQKSYTFLVEPSQAKHVSIVKAQVFTDAIHFKCNPLN